MIELRQSLLFTILLVLIESPVPLYGQGLPQATLTFPEGQDVVQIPFERYQDFIVVSVEFDGVRPLRMIVDTGSPVFVVADTALTNRMNLQIWAQAQVGGAGDGPAETAPLAGGVQAQLGPLQIANAMLLVGVGGDAISGLDGILGGPLFENAVVDIDWAEGVLHVYQPAAFSYEGRGTTLPLTLMPNRHVYTKGTLAINDGEGVPVTLHVDTGARQGIGVLTSSDLPAPTKVVRNTIVAWGSRGPARGDIGRVHRLQLGDLVVSDIVASFREDTPEQGEAAWIGIPVLQQFRPIFDYPGERLILEPNERYGEAFTFATTGLILEPWAVGSAALTVADVVADSPAAQGALKAGDEIMEINGRAVGLLASDEVNGELLKPEPGKVVTVKVRRGEQILTMTLTARRML